LPESVAHDNPKPDHILGNNSASLRLQAISFGAIGF